MKKRIISLFMVLVLCFSLLPFAAMAEEIGEMDIEAENAELYISADAVGFVAIDETNFPDDIFRAYISENFDIDGNGELSAEEIASVEELIIYDMSISDLAGIKYFTSLTKLSCSNNVLTSLDLSGLSSLKTLFCQENVLTSLCLSGLTSLENLCCDANMLTSLDVSGCTSLKTLDCRENALTSLNVSGLEMLEGICCEWNSLRSLNYSGCKSLKQLHCYQNMLTSLDLSECKSLSDLNCSGNKLKTLDISGTALDCCNEYQCSIGYQQDTTITVTMTEVQKAAFMQNCKKEYDRVEVVMGGSVSPIDIVIDTPPAAVGATITAPEGDWVEGKNTFTVECEKACVLLVTNDGGKTYTRLKVTNIGDIHSFTADLTANSQIVCAVKGDISGDGKIRANEAKLILKAANGGSLTALQKQIADVNGDGKIRANEAKLILKAANGGSVSW